MEGAVSERREAFAAAHRSDEDRQAYISTSRRASSVIAKAKAEAWQTTCSSLLLKSNLKTVHPAVETTNSLRWSPHKELCFDWSAGLSTGVFLSIRANMRPISSQWISPS